MPLEPSLLASSVHLLDSEASAGTASQVEVAKQVVMMKTTKNLRLQYYKNQKTSDCNTKCNADLSKY